MNNQNRNQQNRGDGRRNEQHQNFGSHTNWQNGRNQNQWHQHSGTENTAGFDRSRDNRHEELLNDQSRGNESARFDYRDQSDGRATGLRTGGSDERGSGQGQERGQSFGSMYGDSHQGNATYRGYTSPNGGYEPNYGYGGQGYGSGQGYDSGRGFNSAPNFNTQGGSGFYGGSPVHTQPRYGKGPKGYARSDDRIKEEVSDRIAHNGDIDASDVEVNVSKGEVTLSGTVSHRQLKYQLEQLADGVLGVNEVHNQIRVKREDRGTGSSGAPAGNEDKSQRTPGLVNPTVKS